MRKTLTLKTYLFFLLGFCSLTVSGQQDSVVRRMVRFVKNTNTFLVACPQEKVYLHLDNTEYYLGETLWFKAYVMTSAFHRPTPPSSVLYVELLAPEGYIVETQKLKITDGQCHGGFRLDTALYSGYFEIRAYTRAMMNFSPNELFSRVIPVYEKPLKAGDYTHKYLRKRERGGHAGQEEKKKTPPLQLEFFPEGGLLVAGLTSKVAFKATDGEGRDVSVSGDILNNKDEKITSFATLHRGMGTFMLRPDEKKYTAIVNHEDKEYRFQLPEAAPYGYVATIAPSHPDSVCLSVTKSPALPADTLGVAVVCRGWVCYFNLITVTTDMHVTECIPKKALATGVNQIIVFNRKGEPLAERKIFIHGDGSDRITINAVREKERCRPFEPVTLGFRITDPEGLPVQTTFSLSVRDSATAAESHSTDNIMTSLLLSSEIRGFVPDASYYFATADTNRRKHLDLLLMVQGWNRYPWKRIAGVNNFRIQYPIETGNLMDGILYNTKHLKKNIPVSHTRIQFQISKDSLAWQGECITNQQGRFNFMFEDLYGKWDLSLILPDWKKKDKNLFVLKRQFSPVGKIYSFYERNIPDLRVSDYVVKEDTLFRNITLEEAKIKQKNTVRIFNTPTIRAKVTEIFDEMIDRVTQESEALNFDEFGSMIPSYLLDKYHLPSGFSRHIRNYEKNEDAEDAKIALDQRHFIGTDSIIIHTDLETRRQYKPILGNTPVITLIRYSEYFRFLYDKKTYQHYLYEVKKNSHSNQLTDYVIRYIPYPDEKRMPFSPDTRYTYWQGYTIPAEFYAPDYSKTVLPDPSDHRRTIYWNPDVKTDPTGNATVKFYNNATATRLRINAETLTKKGKTGVLAE